MPKQIQKVYQLKVELRGSKPAIWRRILVASDITLVGLHEVLQISMGWTDSHMHLFEHEGLVFGDPRSGFGSLPAADELRTPLDGVLRREKESMTYEYDFGDGWDHRITLEKMLPYNPRLRLPVCTEAKGACPLEDTGGLWGYYSILEALGDSRHPDHAQYKDIFGAGLDPNAFDVDAVNAILHACCGQAA